MNRSDFLPYVAMLAILLAFVGLLVWAWSATGRRDAQPSGREMTARLMRVKDRASQEIAEGLRREDLRRIAQGVDRLRRAAVAADWYVSEARYGAQAQLFREALDAVRQRTDQNDLAGAREAFGRLEASCLACHTAVKADATPPAKAGP